MATIRKSVSIKAPLDQVYAYMTNPENLPEIWPSMVEVSHVKTAPDGSHSFDWVYKMAGIRFKGHSDTVEVEKNKHVRLKTEKGIPNTFNWTYSGENGGTRLNVAIEYAMPQSLLKKLTEPFVQRLNEREAETLLENLKTRMELGAAPEALKRKPEKRAHLH